MHIKTVFSGDIHDANGHVIDPKTPPPPVSEKSPDDWGPYGDRLQFEAAEFIFQDAEMSSGDIDKLCDLWGQSLCSDQGGPSPPFMDHKELYKTIDATPLGDIQWDSFR